MLVPLTLPANQPADRFYQGGEKIAAFRGQTETATDGRSPLEPVAAAQLHTPEDWVASVTCLAGDTELGLTVLPDGRTLADAINADPQAWLGPDHYAAFGPDTKLLVKLLDAGQRLPIHAHPGTAFANEHLGRAHGKAEAWYILQGGVIHLGLKDDVDRETLERLVASQAVEEMLPLLHEIRVAPGDTVFVPAGTLHAIGQGVFLVELQEPEDLSILLEWQGFDVDGEADGHLGLGFDVALDAIDRRGHSLAQISSFITRGDVGDSILAHSADEYFHLGRTVVNGTTAISPGFAVIVTVEGHAQLQSADGHKTPLSAGTTVVVPFDAAPLRLDGDADILIARPPTAGQHLASRSMTP